MSGSAENEAETKFGDPKVPVGVDVPDRACSSAGDLLSAGNCHVGRRTPGGKSFYRASHVSCVTQDDCLQLEHPVAAGPEIGRNVMTVLAFRSRGRHRTGVPALELIASRKPATVNAPVCGNCTSINLSAHTDPGFGDYFVCEDCMTQLDTDGSRL